MKFLYVTILLACLSTVTLAQDTFSIVAVDSTTGEVGSAGATCLQAPNPPFGALIISDVIPGRGAIHTQALWRQFNQDNARNYLEAGFMPEEILHEVNLSDIDADSTIRQYGIALFDAQGSPRAAAFTGVNCFDYKGHNTGTYYAIQGNIITGQELLDSMEYSFLNTTGTLADRLMAALQAANIPGADTRCLSEGVPSKSAFIRVAKPTDHPDSLYLHLVVRSRPYGMSPIDSLQTLYNEWLHNQPSNVSNIRSEIFNVYPNPASRRVEVVTGVDVSVRIYDLLGVPVDEKQCSGRCSFSVMDFAKGVYIIESGGAVRKLLLIQ